MEFDFKKENKAYAIKVTVSDGGVNLGRATLYVLYNDLHDQPFGLMEDVFVEEGNRGKGTGTQLVKKVMEKAKEENCYKLICTSRHTSSKVHEFYAKLGFVSDGERFEEAGIPHLHMTWRPAV